MFYGATIWDPWLIVGQIVCIQCLYYLSLGLLLSLLVGTQVPRFTLNYFFNFSHVSATSFVGWCTIIAYFINSLAGAGYLLVLIERAKKCLDFSATLYIIHLFFCLVYGGFPTTVTWWIVNGCCLVITAVMGEWLCMRRELKDIPIRSTRLDLLQQRSSTQINRIRSYLLWVDLCVGDQPDPVEYDDVDPEFSGTNAGTGECKPNFTSEFLGLKWR